MSDYLNMMKFQENQRQFDMSHGLDVEKFQAGNQPAGPDYGGFLEMIMGATADPNNPGMMQGMSQNMGLMGGAYNMPYNQMYNSMNPYMQQYNLNWPYNSMQQGSGFGLSMPSNSQQQGGGYGMGLGYGY